MPTAGTQNTPIRLTPADRADLALIQERMGLPSLASAVRYSAGVVVWLLTEGEGIPARKKNPKNSQKTP
jgi:hypothetical protein